MVGTWLGSRGVVARIRFVVGMLLLGVVPAVAADVVGVDFVVADVVSVRVWPPGLMDAGIGQPSGAAMQTERFDTVAAGSQAAFTSPFGGGAISGTYSGDFAFVAAGTGTAITSARPQTLYTLTFHHDGTIPGVNFFGLDVDGLDAGSRLTFFRNLYPVASFTGTDLAALFGTCGETAYCGDIAAGQPPGKPYGTVGFTDQTGLFDQVALAQTTPEALFVTGNHTVAYVTASAGSIAVPEPSSIALLPLLLFGLAAARTAWGTVGTTWPMARLGESHFWS